MSTFFHLSGSRVFLNDGTVAAGAKIQFWRAGTTTPLAVYSDNALSSSLGATVTCDLFGLIPAIWLETMLYKFEITESDDTNIFGPADNYDAGDGIATLWCGAAGGTSDALTLTVSGITGLETNRKYRFLAAADNTSTAPTIDINGYGPLVVERAGGVEIPMGTFQSGYASEVVYLSGVNKFQVVGADGSDGSDGDEGGPGLGTNHVIRVNKKNIDEDIDIWDHSTTFTADSPTDTISVGVEDGFADGNIVRLSTTDTLPTGIVADTDYYIRDITLSTCKLAATHDGTAIDITNSGVGTHSLYEPMNAMSAGPITIESGSTVEIKDGSTWSIV